MLMEEIFEHTHQRSQMSLNEKWGNQQSGAIFKDKSFCFWQYCQAHYILLCLTMLSYAKCSDCFMPKKEDDQYQKAYKRSFL